MLSSISAREMIIHGDRYFHPGLSVDCVILGFYEGRLKVLLNKFTRLSNWRLPGGFILKDEHIDDAAARVLQQRTNLKDLYLKQFYTFGGSSRNNMDEFTGLSEFYQYSFSEESWLFQRFVTVAYLSLIDISKKSLPLGEIQNGSSVDWFDIHDLPKLGIDHNEIIKKALEFIKRVENIRSAMKSLLPEKFTLPELQLLYEIIQNEKFDRRNFRRKVLSLNVLEKLDEKKINGGAHKAPDLYSIRKL